MRKLLFLMALVAITSTAFCNESTKGKKITKNNKVKLVKKNKTIEKIKPKEEMDCYPVQINTRCGSFSETMCSNRDTTPSQRQEGYEVIADMYENAVCD